MAADNEIEERGLDIEIFGLVHDSVIAVVRDDLVDDYHELLDRNVQQARGNWDPANGLLAIEGAPIGIDSDSEDGGSRDYGCGKLAKMFPFLAIMDDFDDRATSKAITAIEALKNGTTRDLDPDCKVTKAVLKYPNETIEALKKEADALIS